MRSNSNGLPGTASCHSPSYTKARQATPRRFHNGKEHSGSFRGGRRGWRHIASNTGRWVLPSTHGMVRMLLLYMYNSGFVSTGSFRALYLRATERATVPTSEYARVHLLGASPTSVCSTRTGNTAGRYVSRTRPLAVRSAATPVSITFSQVQINV